jgi:hypothetical protein
MGAETRTAPASVRAPDHDETPAPPDRGPAVALALVVLVAGVGYALAGQLVGTPRVHPDEHIYGGAGASLAEGDGLTLRGEEYELGPVYPAVLAGILAVAGDRETAYAFYRAANGLLFALAAIPIFFLARRLLPPWWSVGVAAFAVAVPSSMYVSLVMTESASYVAYSLAVLAIVLALERPTAIRQLAVVGSIGLAYLTRAQFAVLFASYLAGLVVVWAVDPDRLPLRRALRLLWPSLAFAALGVLAFVVRPLATGSSPLDSVGAYEVLFRGYDPLAIVKWAAYHLADLELYLAIVPVAVAPVALWQLWRRARAGSAQAAAFMAAFLLVNGGMLFVTAAFSSTEFGFDRLHDRNVFYLAPLWLLALAVWLQGGLPRPLVATATGIGLALALPAVMPFRYISSEVGVDVVPSAVWARLQESLAGEALTARKLLALILVAVLVAVAALPRRFGFVFPGLVVATFAVTAVLAWERMIDAPEDRVFADGAPRSWIDDRLPEDASVTKLYLSSSRCPVSALTWHSLYLTEFFNVRVERAAYIDESVPDGLPIDRVDVAADGRLVLSNGDPFEADYVYTQPGIELTGEKLATGTAAALVLWRVGGPVVVPAARSNADLRTADCPPR